MTIAGHEARVRRESPGRCILAEGDQRLVIAIREDSIGDRYASIEACLRGPDLPAREAELLALLDAAETLRAP